MKMWLKGDGCKSSRDATDFWKGQEEEQAGVCIHCFLRSSQ